MHKYTYLIQICWWQTLIKRHMRPWITSVSIMTSCTKNTWTFWFNMIKIYWWWVRHCTIVMNKMIKAIFSDDRIVLCLARKKCIIFIVIWNSMLQWRLWRVEEINHRIRSNAIARQRLLSIGNNSLLFWSLKVCYFK